MIYSIKKEQDTWLTNDEKLLQLVNAIFGIKIDKILTHKQYSDEEILNKLYAIIESWHKNDT